MAEIVDTIHAIDRQELKTKIERRDPFVLLETLAPEHFERAHLPGAVNLPPDRVRELAPTLVPDNGDCSMTSLLRNLRFGSMNQTFATCCGRRGSNARSA